jgi:hypothetical protein
MNLGQLASKAREIVQRRGGTESLKEDAEELKGIASGSGSAADKAKAAAEALKDPGADDAVPTEQASPAAADPAGAEREVDAERAGRRATRRRAGRRRRR